MPGRRPTSAEITERIEFCRALLLKRQPKSTIKRLFRQRFGDVTARTIEDYLSRAREAILADVEATRQNLRDMQLASYESFVANPKVIDRDKLRALERIDKLMGLEAPTRINVGTDDIDGQIAAELAKLADGEHNTSAAIPGSDGDSDDDDSMADLATGIEAGNATPAPATDGTD